MGVLLQIAAALSAWTAYNSAIAIKEVKAYEEPTQQAAKVSGVAEDQLHRTRTTQAAGALASLLSLISSVTFIVKPSPTSKWHLCVAVTNAVAAVFAANHIMKFWHGKATVPLAAQYNDAISKSNNVSRALFGLGVLWIGEAAQQFYRIIAG